jgi:hypothetical protein
MTGMKEDHRRSCDDRTIHIVAAQPTGKLTSAIPIATSALEKELQSAKREPTQNLYASHTEPAGGTTNSKMPVCAM